MCVCVCNKLRVPVHTLPRLWHNRCVNDDVLQKMAKFTFPQHDTHLRRALTGNNKPGCVCAHVIDAQRFNWYRFFFRFSFRFTNFVITSRWIIEFCCILLFKFVFRIFFNFPKTKDESSTTISFSRLNYLHLNVILFEMLISFHFFFKSDDRTIIVVVVVFWELPMFTYNFSRRMYFDYWSGLSCAALN